MIRVRVATFDGDRELSATELDAESLSVLVEFLRRAGDRLPATLDGLVVECLRVGLDSAVEVGRRAAAKA